MEYSIRVEHQSARPIAVVRRTARLQDLPTVVPQACGVAWNLIKAQGLKGGRLVSVYIDDAVRLEVGAELDQPCACSGELIASSLPTGEVATTTHMGPYQHLSKAHDAIREWCKANGRTRAGTNWEIYAHWQNEWKNDPSQIRTDVYYLLAPNA